jgi:hypothetical protein
MDTVTDGSECSGHLPAILSWDCLELGLSNTRNLVCNLKGYMAGCYCHSAIDVHIHHLPGVLFPSSINRTNKQTILCLVIFSIAFESI